MKNYLGQTRALLLLFLLLLIGLAFVPENFTVAGYSLRRMDIFADVRRPVKEGAQIPGEDEIAAQEDSLQPAGPDLTDTLALADSLRTARPLAPLPPVDTGYFGNVIEDYTFDRSGLSRFFAAVDSTRAGRTVRVAWYGDSFVEGDILIGDLRDSLQSLWGGNGVGFVPMTSEVAQFKRTLKHVFRGWTSYSIVKKGSIARLLASTGMPTGPARRPRPTMRAPITSSIPAPGARCGFFIRLVKSCLSSGRTRAWNRKWPICCPDPRGRSASGNGTIRAFAVLPCVSPIPTGCFCTALRSKTVPDSISIISRCAATAVARSGSFARTWCASLKPISTMIWWSYRWG